MRHYVEPTTEQVDGILWRNGEVELIRGQRVNAKILVIVFAIIGALFVVGFLGVGIIDRADDYNSHVHDPGCYEFVGNQNFYITEDGNYYNAVNDRTYYSSYTYIEETYGYDYVAEEVLGNDPLFELNCWFGDSATEYIFDGFFTEALLPCLAIYVVWMLLALIIWLILSRCELVVTNYRVCGRAWFGRRVDLPLDSVSATGTVRWLRRVSVATSSGWISFGWIRNSNKVFSVITQAIIERQRIKAQVAQPTPVAQPAQADASAFTVDEA